MATDAPSSIIIPNIANGGNVGVAETSEANAPPLFKFGGLAQSIEGLGKVVVLCVAVDDRVVIRRAENSVITPLPITSQLIEQLDCFRPQRRGLSDFGFGADTIDAQNLVDDANVLPQQVGAILPIHSGIEAEHDTGTQPAVAVRVVEQPSQFDGIEFSFTVFTFRLFTRQPEGRLVGRVELTPVHRKRNDDGVINAPPKHCTHGANVSGFGGWAEIAPMLRDGSEVSWPHVGDDRSAANIIEHGLNGTAVFLERVELELAGFDSGLAISFVGNREQADTDCIARVVHTGQVVIVDELVEQDHRFGLGAGRFSEVANLPVDAFYPPFEGFVVGQMAGDFSRHVVAGVVSRVVSVYNSITENMTNATENTGFNYNVAETDRTSDLRFRKPYQSNRPANSSRIYGEIASVGSATDIANQGESCWLVVRNASSLPTARSEA